MTSCSCRLGHVNHAAVSVPSAACQQKQLTQQRRWLQCVASISVQRVRTQRMAVPQQRAQPGCRSCGGLLSVHSGLGV
jgi:hypothetical protein